jgi:hypothetical protein
MKEKKPEISPSIEAAISQIEEEDASKLRESNVGAYFDQLVYPALKKLQTKSDSFIKDFISNPNNKWRIQFEESASKGYAGLKIDHSSFEYYEIRALKQLGFRFTANDNIQEVWWPTDKAKQ